jgi:hypothetical protein
MRIKPAIIIGEPMMRVHGEQNIFGNCNIPSTRKDRKINRPIKLKYDNPIIGAMTSLIFQFPVATL